MKFLSEKDDVITAVLSKPAARITEVSGAGFRADSGATPRSTETSSGGISGGANRFLGVPNGAVRTKVKIRKSGDIYRTETTAGTQVFHGKLERAELDGFLAANIPAAFKNAVIETTTETITILANKKGKCTVLRKKKNAQQTGAGALRGAVRRAGENPSFSDVRAKSAGCAANLSELRNVPLSSAEMLAAGKTMHLSQPHDRQKNYLLKEGTPVSFLVRLGIMTPDGKIHAQKYSKFRQINRFLEYVDDILPELVGRTETDTEKLDSTKTGTPEVPETDATATPTQAESRVFEIVDFGCGKSYLTFAVYYYLTAIKGLTAHITGIDLKKDVIQHCKQLASDCGYKGMEFICGDVADFKGGEHPDLVITLHACDTATDYALSYAVKNEAKCILSVPCCQHELNSLLKKRVPDNAFSTMFKYGIIKERLSALATDVMRAELLENSGYSTQILEFIDMEDTPKNLLIRAVKRGKPAQSGESAQKLVSGNTPVAGNSKDTDCATQIVELEELKSARKEKDDGLEALKNALGQTITLEKLLSQEE